MLIPPYIYLLIHLSIKHSIFNHPRKCYLPIHQLGFECNPSIKVKFKTQQSFFTIPKWKCSHWPYLPILVTSILQKRGPPPLITAHYYIPESVTLSPRADNLDLQLLPPSLVQVLWGDPTWGERGPGLVHQNPGGQNGHKPTAAQEILHQQ